MGFVCFVVNQVLWQKVSWFRSDDEIVGKACNSCKKNFGSLMRKKLQELNNA